MHEVDFEGQQVAFAIGNTSTGHDAAAALVGCAYYHEDPDVIWQIIGVEWPGPVFAMQGASGQQRLTVPRLARGYIIETREQSRLAPLIAQAKPPHIAAAEEAQRWLVKAGIHHQSFSNDDAVQLADALAAGDEHRPPPHNVRALIADLMKRYGLYRSYISHAKKWLEMTQAKGERALVDVIIQLTSAYRELKDYPAALQCTEIVVAPDAAKQIPPVQRVILLTQRSAIHLDFYDYNSDASHLKLARKCAGKAWAIQPSDYISALYIRLKQAEDVAGDRRADDARFSAQKRLAAVRRKEPTSISDRRGHDD